MRYFYIIKDYFAFSTWSELAKIGNSPTAKAAALAPLLGWFILYLKDNVERFKWLSNIEITPELIITYWALISISLAQVIFVAFCPNLVKTYTNEIDRYVVDAMQSNNDMDLRGHSIKQFNEIYSRENYAQIKLPPITALDSTNVPPYLIHEFNEYIRFRETHFPGNEIALREGYRWPLLVRLFNSDTTGYFFTDLYSFGTDHLTKDKVNFHKNIHTFLRDRSDGRMWKQNSLKRNYSRLNLSKSFTRFACTSFYILGIGWLIYRALLSILEVFIYTLSIAPQVW